MDDDVVVLDDLSTGTLRKVPNDVPLVRASVLDQEAVQKVLLEHQVAGVIHLAAKKSVEESVHHPLWYFEENVEGFRRLLSAMQQARVSRLVLSSSAAVYGMPDLELIAEDVPLEPINPYGASKASCEWLARGAAEAHGLRTVMLRYFNVAGAGNPALGDPSVTNLVPLILRALRRGEQPRIFGADYATPDGTCIRDYIHVQDLADAHVAAARAVDRVDAPKVFNVSRGVGSSVREVMEIAGAVTGLVLEPRVEERRPGDPARLVGSAAAIAEGLGWVAQHDLSEMLASAWEAAEEGDPRA